MGIQLHGINLIDKVLSLVAKRNINTEIQIIDWGNSYIKPSAIKWIKEKNPQWILKKVNFIVEFRVIQLR